MLTNNFYSLMQMAFAVNSSSLVLPLVDVQGKSTYITNGAVLCPAAKYWFDLSNTQATRSGWSGSSYSVIWFGSDATPAVRGNYTLGAPLAESALTFGLATSDGGDDASGHSFSEKTLRVIANADITISEVGLIMPCVPSGSRTYDIFSGTYNSFGCGILIDRTVLDTPLVLAANEVGFVKYRITNETEFPE